ncbi:hypothetical protein [Nonomuraea sp. NPDC049400]
MLGLLLARAGIEVAV